LTEIQKNFPGDDAGVQSRLIAATVKGIRVLNAYVPHGTRIGTPKFEYKLEWLAFLRRYLDEFYNAEDDVLLCGDFNITPHEMDLWDTALWRNKLHYTKPERDALIEVKRWGFVDLFRQLNPDAREYSWWGMFHPHMFPHNKGLRLDHIWATEPLAEICTDCWIDKEPRGWEKPSDHAPVIAEFST
jgi:exodeoxyribonuclease III